MDITPVVVTSLAALSLVALGCFVVYVVAVLGSRGGSGPAPLLWVSRIGGEYGIWLAAVVGVVMTAGSLYLSEVAHFVPCELCWFQRIAAYPLAVIGVVAVVRRDRKMWTYAVPLAAAGLAVSVWHLGVERVPALSDSASCSSEAPCSLRWVWEFGFVSIPFMAAVGFVCVITASLAARRGSGSSSVVDADQVVDT